MVNFGEFIKGSIDELKKVSWPTKDEVVRATVATIIFVGIFSGILFSVDSIVRILLQRLMS